MAKDRAASPPPFRSPLKDEAPEGLHSLSNSELLSFLESSFRRSEFIRVANILRIREESAKVRYSKDLSAKLSLRDLAIAELQDKHEKDCDLLKSKLEDMKKDCVVLRANEVESEENIKSLRKDIQNMREENEMLPHLKVEIKTLQCANKIAHDDLDLWKRKYSSLEAWILRYTENNPKVRVEAINGDEPTDIFSMDETVTELLKSDTTSHRKKSFKPIKNNSKDLIDLSSGDIELVGASFDDIVTPIRSSKMKYSFGKYLDSVGSSNKNKNCSIKKCQLGQTSGVKRVLEGDDDDDVVCIGESIKKFSKGIKEQKNASGGVLNCM